jgi:hypothetical protein
MKTHPDWINPDFDLAGVDPNASAVIAAVRQALKDAGNSRAVVEAYMAEARQGDYDHLLTVSLLYSGQL